MFHIEHISGGAYESRVRDVTIRIDEPLVQAVICPDINTIDEIVSILRNPASITSGRILLDHRPFGQGGLSDKVAFVTRRNNLYDNLTVADNIEFSREKVPFFVSNRRIRQRCEELIRKVDYSIELDCKVRYLSYEQKMIVSILRAMALKPRLLVVNEIHGQLSYKGLACFMRILDILKKDGTMVLYFTSQWEDSVKIGDMVTVISHGRTYGDYSVEEIKKSPDRIYHVMLGGGRLDDGPEERNREQSDFLRTLSQGVGDLKDGYDQNNMLKDLAKMIRRELHGTHCAIFLIDEEQNSLMEVADEEGKRLPRIRAEKLKELNRTTDFSYSSISEKTEFVDYFEGGEPGGVEAVFGCPVKTNGKNAGVILVFYEEYYVYSEKDRLYLGLIGREIAMLVENSKLMNRSVLLRESHHRIKNNLQIIISLLQMEKVTLDRKLKHEESVAEVREMIDGIIGRIKSIATIHNILAHDGSINNVANIDDIIEEIRRFYGYAAEIRVETGKVFVPYSRAASMALVVNELIHNSIKHGGTAGEKMKIDIAIRREADKERFVLTYHDSGRGFSEDFDEETQTGVGIMIIASIVRQEFRGEVNFRNRDGAYVEIIIPQRVLF